MTKFIVICLIAFLSFDSVANSQTVSNGKCPGWTKVSLDWNKSVKEFCAQYGEDCKAVSAMYQPPDNAMDLDPLYGTYDKYLLINPDAKQGSGSKSRSDILEARSIDCENYSPSPEELAKKAFDATQEKVCLEKGGKWMGHIMGRGRLWGCNMPTKDSGKQCHGMPRECEGPCVDFKCYGWTQYKGCDYVKDGKIWCAE